MSRSGIGGASRASHDILIPELNGHDAAPSSSKKDQKVAMSQARNALGVMELSLEDFENSIDRTWHEQPRNKGSFAKQILKSPFWICVLRCPECLCLESLTHVDSC